MSSRATELCRMVGKFDLAVACASKIFRNDGFWTQNCRFFLNSSVFSNFKKRAVKKKLNEDRVLITVWFFRKLNQKIYNWLLTLAPKESLEKFFAQQKLDVAK